MWSSTPWAISVGWLLLHMLLGVYKALIRLDGLAGQGGDHRPHIGPWLALDLALWSSASHFQVHETNSKLCKACLIHCKNDVHRCGP